MKKYFKELPEYSDFKNKSKWFANNTTINTLQEFQDCFTDDINNKSFIFRGINEARFKLFSSAQRRWSWKGFKRFFSSREAYVRYLIENFKNRDFNYTGTEYSILALIQHYGGYSPLIDFSYDFKSALFFSFNNLHERSKKAIDNYCSLYVIDYTHPILAGVADVYKKGGEALDQMLEKDDIYINKPNLIDASKVKSDYDSIHYDHKNFNGHIVEGGKKSIIPMVPSLQNKPSMITNPNLQAQSGCFFQCFYDDKPLEEVLFSDNLKSPVITCYNIKKKLKDEIFQLYQNDMKQSSIYPHFDGQEIIIENIKKIENNIIWDFLKNGLRKLDCSTTI